MNSQAPRQSNSEADRALMRASAQRFVGKLSLQQINGCLAGLLVFYALSVANCCNFFLPNGGQLQTTSASWNFYLSILLFLLPAASLLIYLATSSTYKWWVLTGILLIAFPSALLAIIHCLLGAPEPLYRFPVGKEFVSCFRVPDFDLHSTDIQRQKTVMPGIVWSVPIYRERFAYNVTATLSDAHHLRCVFDMDTEAETDQVTKNVTVLIR